MKTGALLKAILVGISLLGIVGIGSYLLLNENKSGNTLPEELFGWKYPVTKFPLVGPDLNQIAYSDIRDPGGIPEGLPVRLKIPVIGVDSAIEDALITPDGRMDVPSGSVNVAWFSLGPHPGRVGSAVIGGHFGIKNGVKFVFYDLDKLKVDDKIYIENDRGETLAFQVRKIMLFDRNADATTVFTSDDGLAHLNLITCEGVWNRVNDTYPERRVVFTDAIPGEGAVPNNHTFPRLLSVGAYGVDVATLQTILEQKGFLVIPAGIKKGFFGELTRSAVTKYQISVGLPSVGILGPLTRARLTSELESAKPKLPRTSIRESGSFVFPKNIIQPLKNLYATPIYGLITSLLLILIILMIFKIIRRHRQRKS